MSAIDYDSIDAWAPSLAAALQSHVPPSIWQELKLACPEYVEDARRHLFELTDEEAVIETVIAWIQSNTLLTYHGSRLTDADVASIRSVGLVPLQATERRNRLVRALSSHPEWLSAAPRLETTLQAHGPGNAAGRREGAVHLTLSKAGLVGSFSHYLTHGSEFDQHVTHALLGDDGFDLLARDGTPTLFQIAVPGALALEAAHPIFTLDDLRARGDLPNIVRQFLEAWSYSLAHPGFQPGTLKVDCGIRFRSTVSATWIVGVELLKV